MSVYKHKNGYYGYNFSYKGKRYCRTFKGISKEEVANLEIAHKFMLIQNGYDITKRKTYYLKDIVIDFKEYAKGHYTRPNDFDYVINNFVKLIGNKDISQIVKSDIEKYVCFRLNSVKNSTINREMDIIKRIFSLAVENRKLSINPCSTFKKLRIDNPPERFLTKDEEMSFPTCTFPYII